MDKKDPTETTFSFPTCGGKPKVPSDKETEALTAMKAIKERVRHLKASKGKADPGDSEALDNELARLKTDWETWEDKRAAAAKERMILLGHEEHPSGQD
ncbi:MAG: hypothetical protein U5R49_08440 [Deltaproteobacteria bacterium]|nr:hypothetical protein [Deltaproteobacteria bacterium]